MDLRRITNEDEARSLAHRLLMPRVRTLPAVVITTPSGDEEPYVDAEAVQLAVGDRVEVFVLPSGKASWAFTSEMPQDTGVYGGAARIYPVGHGWVSYPWDSPLRLAYSMADRERVTGQIIADVHRLVPNHRPAKKQEIDPLDKRIDELEQEVARLKERNAKLDQARIKATAKLKSINDSMEQQVGGGPYFLDPEEDFRFEVYCEWVRRIPPTDKATLPLAEYFLGPEFLASLENMEGISREKVVAVVVEVLTGLASTSGARDAHPLRYKNEPASNPVTRADGGVCWRLAIQREAPAARRLHYWKVQDWYELSRVVVHDDYRP